MLAVLLPQRIHTLIEMREPLQTNGLPKKIELTVIGFRELEQDDPGSTVQGYGGEEFLKGRRYGSKNVIGKLSRAGELDLKSGVSKLLCAQKDHHPLGRQLVLARFHARVLDVFRKLGEHK